MYDGTAANVMVWIALALLVTGAGLLVRPADRSGAGRPASRVILAIGVMEAGAAFWIAAALADRAGGLLGAAIATVAWAVSFALFVRLVRLRTRHMGEQDHVNE
jgi:hypothetical protein